MPRVYKRTAGKDYPAHGIVKGDTYYAWSFYREPERKSKTYPKPSQLTNIDSHATVYAAFEWEGELDGPEAIQSIIDELEGAKSEEEDKLSNLEEVNLQDGERGQAISENVSALEEAISSLEELKQEWEEALELQENGDEGAEEALDRDWGSEVSDLQPELQ